MFVVEIEVADGECVAFWLWFYQFHILYLIGSIIGQWPLIGWSSLWMGEIDGKGAVVVAVTQVYLRTGLVHNAHF